MVSPLTFFQRGLASSFCVTTAWTNAAGAQLALLFRRHSDGRPVCFNRHLLFEAPDDYDSAALVTGGDGADDLTTFADLPPRLRDGVARPTTGDAFYSSCMASSTFRHRTRPALLAQLSTCTEVMFDRIDFMCPRSYVLSDFYKTRGVSPAFHVTDLPKTAGK